MAPIASTLCDSRPLEGCQELSTSTRHVFAWEALWAHGLRVPSHSSLRTFQRMVIQKRTPQTRTEVGGCLSGLCCWRAASVGPLRPITDAHRPCEQLQVVCQPASEPPSGDTSAGSPSARPGPPVGSGSPAAFSAVSSVAWQVSRAWTPQRPRFASRRAPTLPGAPATAIHCWVVPPKRGWLPPGAGSPPPLTARRSPLPQALLFVDGRAAGRLTQPLVTIDSEGGAAQVSLHFQTLAPARGGEEQPLQLPADELSSRSLRVQVFGRQGDSTFAAPQSFQAEGRELVAALAVQRQWQEYQRRHQAARQSAGQPTSAANFAHSSTLAVQSGAQAGHGLGMCSHAWPCLPCDVGAAASAGTRAVLDL